MAFNSRSVNGWETMNPYSGYLNYYSGVYVPWNTFHYSFDENINRSMTTCSSSNSSIDAIHGSPINQGSSSPAPSQRPSTSFFSSIDVMNGSPITQVHYPHAAPTPPSQQQSTSSSSSNRPSRKCTVCSITETCKWRNVRSNDGILCNACFIYQRKYDSTRPDKAQNNYKKRKEDKKMKSVNK